MIVYRGADWTIFRLRGAQPIVQPGRGAGVADVLALDHESIALRVSAPGTYVVKVSYSPYWQVVTGMGTLDWQPARFHRAARPDGRRDRPAHGGHAAGTLGPARHSAAVGEGDRSATGAGHRALAGPLPATRPGGLGCECLGPWVKYVIGSPRLRGAEVPAVSRRPIPFRGMSAAGRP